MSTFIDGKLDRNRAQYLLTMQDEVIRGMADNWPKPRWIKFLSDGDGVLLMVWMNRACANRFYPDPYKAIGHCDRICHSDDAARHYAQTDHAAIEQAGTVLVCDEPDPNGGTVRVHKLAYRIDNNNLKGWAVYGECPD